MAAPFDYGRKEWREDANAAFEEAQRRVAWAAEHPEEPWLFLSDLGALPKLPSELGKCEHLLRLSLGRETGPDDKFYSFPGRRSFENWMILSRLSLLQRLDVAVTNMANLKPVTGAARLQSLNLEDSLVSDLSPIAGATALMNLNLAHTQVRDLSPIAGATALKSLNLTDTPVSDLSPIRGATGLLHLFLNEGNVSDLSPISGATALKRLSLSENHLSDLSPIAGAEGLQSLVLRNTEVTDLSPIASAVGLQNLDLTSTQVTDLSPIAGAVGLQNLNLANTQVADLAPLAGAAGLQRLNLMRTQVADLSPLAGVAGLQSLDLAVTQVTDLSPLAGATRLQGLKLWGTQVADLSPLLSNPAFTSDDPFELEIRGTPLADLDDDWREVAAHGKSQDTTRAAARLLKGFVFLSYKREERERAAAVRRGLLASGFNVWWDDDIWAEANYRAQIAEKLEGAYAVLSLWSERGARSDWMQAEADRGHARGRLVCATIDGAPPPLPFTARQLSDLTEWRGGAAYSDFQKICDALRRLRRLEETEEEREEAKRTGVAASARMDGVVEGGKAGLVEQPKEAEKPFELAPELREEIDDQIKRVTTALKAIDVEAANFPKEGLKTALTMYRDALSAPSPDIGEVEPVFDLLGPNLSDEITTASLSPGMQNLLAKIAGGHEGVERAIRKTSLRVGAELGPKLLEDRMEAADLLTLSARLIAELGGEAAEASTNDTPIRFAATRRRLLESVAEDDPRDDEAERARKAALRRTAAIGLAGIPAALLTLKGREALTEPEAYRALMEVLERDIWPDLSAMFEDRE